jgi:serine/threonine-protein kinase
MVLRRMLAVYPGDRYQTATEVLQDLQSFGAVPLESTLLRSPDPAALSPSQPEIVNFLSPQSDRLNQTVKPAQPTIQQSATPDPMRVPRRGSTHTPDREWRRWDNIGGKVRAGIAATLLAGLGIALPIVWQLGIKAPETNGEVWVSGAKLPQSEASRIIDAPDASGSNLAIKPPFEPNQAEPGQTEIPGTDSAVVKTKPQQRLQFARGKVTTAVQGHLQATEMQPYILQASQGQIMSVTLQGAGAVMNLLRSNQEAIDAASHQTRSWTGQLPADDRYMIQVSGTGAYTLDVAITPLARPTQEQIQHVAFAPGSSGTTVTGQIAPNQIQRYLLKAKQGQILVVKVLQGSVSFSAIAPNGQRIGSNATNTKSWQGRLPQDGAYMIEVSGNEPEGYAIALEVL